MTYIRKKSQKQEKRTANDFNGRTQIASGALFFAKADVRTDDFLIENKFTDNDNYILKYAIWDKIEEEAMRESLREPLLQIDIQNVSIVIADYYYMTELFSNCGFKPKIATVCNVTTGSSTILSKETFNLSSDECVEIYFWKYKKKLLVLKLGKFKDLLDL